MDAVLKRFPLFSDWFRPWHQQKGGWPAPGKTRTAAGLLLLWSKTGISTLEEVASVANMTLNSLRVARTEKIFKLICEQAALSFHGYLFDDCGLAYLRRNETELFHTLDALSEETSEVFFNVIAYPDSGVNGDDQETCEAYLAARDFLLQICWLTLSRSKNIEMSWTTRKDAAAYLDKSFAKLRVMQKFYADLHTKGGSVQHPANRKFWKK